MAYLDARAETHERTAAALAVTALQGALAVALVYGLAVDFIPRAEKPRTEGTLIPLDPPPPPPSPRPDPAVKPDVRPIVPEAYPLLPSRPIIGPGVEPLPVPSGPSEDLVTTSPSPKPLPSFTPRGAVPRNNPGGWVTQDDYPSRDLREGNQGRVSFRLAISPDGRVTGCEITASSGFARLDAATCANVAKRARFDPAQDASGAATSGRYSGSVRWVIPD